MNKKLHRSLPAGGFSPLPLTIALPRVARARQDASVPAAAAEAEAAEAAALSSAAEVLPELRRVGREFGWEDGQTERHDETQ